MAYVTNVDDNKAVVVDWCLSEVKRVLWITRPPPHGHNRKIVRQYIHV